jgi:cephalosporin-C deacetylase-like acetyl esterase
MITDQEAASDLSNIIKEISFLFTFYSKFEKTIQKLDFKEKNNELNGYLKTFTSFSWLLYVEAKNKVLNRSLETISNTCLLAHVLCVMIIYGWEYLKPQALMAGEKRLTLDSPINELKKVVK